MSLISLTMQWQFCTKQELNHNDEFVWKVSDLLTLLWQVVNRGSEESKVLNWFYLVNLV